MTEVRCDNSFILQSSWTKKAAEVDSPQPISPRYQSADDSICAQVIHTKPESFSNGWVHLNEPKDGLEQDEQPGIYLFLLLCGTLGWIFLFFIFNYYYYYNMLSGNCKCVLCLRWCCNAQRIGNASI